MPQVFYNQLKRYKFKKFHLKKNEDTLQLHYYYLKSVENSLILFLNAIIVGKSCNKRKISASIIFLKKKYYYIKII